MMIESIFFYLLFSIPFLLGLFFLYSRLLKLRLSYQRQGGQQQEKLKDKWLLLLWFILMLVFFWLIYSFQGGLQDQLLGQKIRAHHMTDNTLMHELIPAIRRRLNRQPDNGYYLLTVANADMEAGNYIQAASHYQHLTKLFPNNAAFFAQHAQALLLNGSDITKVEESLSHSLQFDPGLPQALEIKGLLAIRAGNIKEAQEYWQHALLRRQPDSLEAKTIKQWLTNIERLTQPADSMAVQPGGEDKAALKKTPETAAETLPFSTDNTTP